MRISHQVSGGLAYFPGLAKSRAIDTCTLTADQADELRQLATAAGFFELPRKLAKVPKGSADVPQHTLTIEDGQRSNTIQIFEPVSNPALAALLSKVQECLREAE